MKGLVFATALLACSCAHPADAPAAGDASAGPRLEGVTLPLADGAGNRMEALTQAGDRWCTGDGAWCASLLAEAIVGVRNHHVNTTFSAAPINEGDRLALWPNVIRVGDNSALVGVTTTDEEMYSGGSGRASHLTLYEVSGVAAHEAITMPLGGAADIRACFDEGDEHQRAGACQDLYQFVTRVGLDESVTNGAPRIVLETAAGSYPGRVTRHADSLEAPALEPSELVWAHDETCSYRRVFNRGADGLYAPDQPLPACSDYLEP